MKKNLPTEAFKLFRIHTQNHYWAENGRTYDPFISHSLDDRLLAGVVVLDVEVGEEDDAGVRGQEDEDVPEAVQVREAEPGPEAAQQAVAHPAQHR